MADTHNPAYEVRRAFVWQHIGDFPEVRASIHEGSPKDITSTGDLTSKRNAQVCVRHQWAQKGIPDDLGREAAWEVDGLRALRVQPALRSHPSRPSSVCQVSPSRSALVCCLAPLFFSFTVFSFSLSFSFGHLREHRLAGFIQSAGCWHSGQSYCYINLLNLKSCSESFKCASNERQYVIHLPPSSVPHL